jgi:uncharacterized transporter YbjL
MKPAASTPYEIMNGAARVMEEDIRRRQVQQERDPDFVLKPGDGMTLAGYVREMARAVEVKRQMDMDAIQAMKDRELKEMRALIDAELKERASAS